MKTLIFIILLSTFSISAIYKVKNNFSSACFNSFIQGQLRNIPEISIMQGERMEFAFSSPHSNSLNQFRFFYKGIQIGRFDNNLYISEFHNISLSSIDSIEIHTANDAIKFLGKPGIAINLLPKEVKMKQSSYGGNLLLGSQMGDPVIYREILPTENKPTNREKIAQGDLFFEKGRQNSSLRFTGTVHRYSPHRYIRQNLELKKIYSNSLLELSLGNLYTNSTYTFANDSTYNPTGLRQSLGALYWKQYGKLDFSIANTIYIERFQIGGDSIAKIENGLSENYSLLKSTYNGEKFNIKLSYRYSLIQQTQIHYSDIDLSLFKKSFNLLLNTEGTISTNYRNNFKDLFTYNVSVSTNYLNESLPLNSELIFTKEFNKINITQAFGYAKNLESRSLSSYYQWNQVEVFKNWQASSFYSPFRYQIMLNYAHNWKRLNYALNIKHNSDYRIENNLLILRDSNKGYAFKTSTSFGCFFFYSFLKEKLSLHFSLQDAGKNNIETPNGNPARTSAYFGCKLRLQ